MGTMATSVRQAVRGRWPAPGAIHDAWTADDLAALPDDGLRYEIVEGTLVVSPSPTPRHQRACRRLARTLEDACPADLEVFEAPLDWAADDRTVLQPDILVMRAVDITAVRLTGVPVLVAEIASASSRRIDRTLKSDAYARAGVGQYWIVDPGDEHTTPTIEVFDLHRGAYRRQAGGAGDDAVAVTGPIAVTLTPADLVAPPRRA